MAEAEVKLASTLSEEGGRERLNVENLEGGGQQVNPSNMISTIIRYILHLGAIHQYRQQ